MGRCAVGLRNSLPRDTIATNGSAGLKKLLERCGDSRSFKIVRYEKIKGFGADRIFVLKHINGSTEDKGAGGSLFWAQVIPKPLPLGFPGRNWRSLRSQTGVVLLCGFFCGNIGFTLLHRARICLPVSLASR